MAYTVKLSASTEEYTYKTFEYIRAEAVRANAHMKYEMGLQSV